MSQKSEKCSGTLLQCALLQCALLQCALLQCALLQCALLQCALLQCVCVAVVYVVVVVVVVVVFLCWRIVLRSCAQCEGCVMRRSRACCMLFFVSELSKSFFLLAPAEQ